MRSKQVRSSDNHRILLREKNCNFDCTVKKKTKSGYTKSLVPTTLCPVPNKFFMETLSHVTQLF